MKLRPEFKNVHSNLMSLVPSLSLDIYLSELLREEQRLVTQATLAQKAPERLSMSHMLQGENLKARI